MVPDGRLGHMTWELLDLILHHPDIIENYFSFIMWDEEIIIFQRHLEYSSLFLTL